MGYARMMLLRHTLAGRSLFSAVVLVCNNRQIAGKAPSITGDSRPAVCLSNHGTSNGGRFAVPKECRVCGQTKPLEEFVKHKGCRDGYAGSCIACASQRKAEWKQRRRESTEPRRCARCEEVKARSEFGNHPSYCLDCQHALDRKYRAKPQRKERKRVTNAKWRDNNREHRSEYKTARLADPVAGAIDRSSGRVRNRRYYASHKQRCFDHRARRRARERGAFEEKVDRLAIAERDRWMCHICGKKVARKDMSLDHLIPIALGGKHCALNVRLAHMSCNQRRGIGRKIPAQLILFNA